MTEIYRGHSVKAPGKTNLVVFTHTREEAYKAIQDLADEFHCVQFSQPSRVSNGRWGVMGSGWDEED